MSRVVAELRQVAGERLELIAAGGARRDVEQALGHGVRCGGDRSDRGKRSAGDRGAGCASDGGDHEPAGAEHDEQLTQTVIEPGSGDQDVRGDTRGLVVLADDEVIVPFDRGRRRRRCRYSRGRSAAGISSRSTPGLEERRMPSAETTTMDALGLDS